MLWEFFRKSDFPIVLSIMFIVMFALLAVLLLLFLIVTAVNGGFIDWLTEAFTTNDKATAGAAKTEASAISSEEIRNWLAVIVPGTTGVAALIFSIHKWRAKQKTDQK